MCSDSDIEQDGISFLIREEWTLETPADGPDGDSIIHFEGAHTNCTMKVKLVNGEREGKATVFKEGRPLFYLEYKDGLPNGVIERVNESGEVELRVSTLFPIPVSLSITHPTIRIVCFTRTKSITYEERDYPE